MVVIHPTERLPYRGTGAHGRSITGKRLELLKEAVPGVTRVGRPHESSQSSVQCTPVARDAGGSPGLGGEVVATPELPPGGADPITG